MPLNLLTTVTTDRVTLTSRFIQRVPKRYRQTHGGNIVKSQPIFKILLPLERELNFQ